MKNSEGLFKKILRLNEKYWKSKQIPLFKTDKRIYIAEDVSGVLSVCATQICIAKSLQSLCRIPSAIISSPFPAASLSSSKQQQILAFSKSCKIPVIRYPHFFNVWKPFFHLLHFCITGGSFEKLLHLQYRKMDIGACVYDHVAKVASLEGKFDGKQIGPSIWCRTLLLDLLLIEKLYALFKKHPPQYFIVKQPLYEYGIMSRTACELFHSDVLIASGVYGEYISNIQAANPNKNKYQTWYNVYQNYKKSAENFLYDNQDEDLFLYNFGNCLDKSREDILNELNINNGKKNVIVMLHCLADAPREAALDFSCFTDYREWYEKTLSYIKSINSVNWLIRDHPQSKYYGQTQYVYKLFQKAKQPNIVWFDKAFSGNTIRNIADVIVTFSGDVGCEYTSYGIPCIVCSETAYTRLNIGFHAKTREQYYQLLSHAASLKISDVRIIAAARKFTLARKRSCKLEIMNLANRQTASIWRKENPEKINSSFYQEYINLMKDDRLYHSDIDKLLCP